MKMKARSYWLITILVLAIFAVSGVAAAVGTDKGSAEVMPSGRWVEVPQAIASSPDRVIAPTTSFIDKAVFRMKGCKILNELNDATVLKCPPGVAIKGARPDRIFHILDMEADVQIGADDIWTQGILGTGVNVAVLDTGIDMTHPELSDSYIDGYDYVDNDNIPEDWHGHGTHVSGIITANGDNPNATGVAPGAGIYMYKVCGTYGCYDSDMIAAMEAAIAKKAEDPTLKVMSISIGGGNFAAENCDSDPLAAKVNEVVSHGITVVVASGNDRFYVSSPACASGAIAVGAVDKTGLMASFSNYGPALDIVAPGVSIYSSLIGGYDSWSGTSMSTPHVSGTVALILEANPGLTDTEIKTALYKTANNISGDSVCYDVVRQRGSNYWIGVVPCTSNHYGAGLVDAYGAVNYFTQSEPECGNNVTESGEVCDAEDLVEETCETQGYDYGTLGCSPDCLSFDTTVCSDYDCGNGVIEGSEECDSKNLGWETCETLEYDGGTLACTDTCTFDTSGCTTTEPELPSCGACFKGVCDDICHPRKETASCLDCSA